MIKRNFVVDFIMIQLVFGVKLFRIDVNHGPARRDLVLETFTQEPDFDLGQEYPIPAENCIVDQLGAWEGLGASLLHSNTKRHYKTEELIILNSSGMPTAAKTA